MSDGHRETVRGSHRDPQGDPHSKPLAAAAGTQPGAAGARVRQSDETVIAWRVWRLATLAQANPRVETSQAFVIMSTYMMDIWRPGTMKTACCGAATLRHGIHAFATQAQALDYVGEVRTPFRYVFGEVSLWGRTIVHERGYRAQFAYPRRIFVPKQYRGGRDIVNELRRAYGVEADWTP